MKTIKSSAESNDTIIEELYRHKRVIAREHGDDIEALLRDLRERQVHDSRAVPSIKGNPTETPNP